MAACIQAGILPQEEAAVSEKRHVITRAVGAEEAIEVDARLVAVEPGDLFLVCSDGLHGEVSDHEISALVAGADLTGVAAGLVKRANDGGGLDNVTVVLVRIG
jgi:serine/threonine protein phosphatase PrpC